MFKFIVLILAFMVSVRADPPPTRAAGQGETLKPAFNLYFPPSTVSDMGGINKFIDTGSENLLINSGFEAQTVSSGWTISNATASAGTAFRGLKSLSLSLTGLLSLSQEITATQYHPNVVSFSLWVKSSITDIQLCSTLATVEQECVSYDGSNQWKKLQVLVTSPSSGAMGLKLKTISTTSGTILVDNGEFSSNPLKFKDGVDENVELRAVNTTAYSIPTSPSTIGYGIVDYNTHPSSWNGSTFTAPIEGTYTIHAQYATSNNAILIWFIAIYKNGLLYSMSSQTRQSSHSAPEVPQITDDIKLVKGDTVDIRIWSNSGGFFVTTSASDNFITIRRIRKSSSQILTANDVVSSETINWQFKSTAITDSDPVGTYNTYSGTKGSYIVCGTSPSVLPNNNDGALIRGASSSTSSSCSDPSIYAIKIGKGLKGTSLRGYESAGKSAPLVTDLAKAVYSFASGTWTGQGFAKSYDEMSGVLTVSTHDGNYWQFERSNGTFTSLNTQAYFHFTASKNPVISALDAVPRIDYSWENEFSARIANNGTASIISQNYPFIDSVTRVNIGWVQVNFKPGFFTQIPAINVSPLYDSVQDVLIEYYNLTTSGVLVKVVRNDGVNVYDNDFSIRVSRQGSDYRSRGDAAAIIAQPTIWVRNKQPDTVNGGTMASSVWATNNLTTIEGSNTFGASLSANQITLPKGTYIIEWNAPFVYIMNNISWYVTTQLYSTTTSSTLIKGDTAYSYTTGSDEQRIDSFGRGTITLTATTTMELRYYSTKSQATYGQGINDTITAGDEYYASVKITKVR